MRDEHEEVEAKQILLIEKNCRKKGPGFSEKTRPMSR
jgi:hypothetical protein